MPNRSLEFVGSTKVVRKQIKIPKRYQEIFFEALFVKAFFVCFFMFFFFVWEGGRWSHTESDFKTPLAFVGREKLPIFPRNQEEAKEKGESRTFRPCSCTSNLQARVERWKSRSASRSSKSRWKEEKGPPSTRGRRLGCNRSPPTQRCSLPLSWCTL